MIVAKERTMAEDCPKCGQEGSIKEVAMGEGRVRRYCACCRTWDPTGGHTLYGEPIDPILRTLREATGAERVAFGQDVYAEKFSLIFRWPDGCEYHAEIERNKMVGLRGGVNVKRYLYGLGGDAVRAHKRYMGTPNEGSSNYVLEKLKKAEQENRRALKAVGDLIQGKSVEHHIEHVSHECNGGRGSFGDPPEDQREKAKDEMVRRTNAKLRELAEARRKARNARLLEAANRIEKGLPEEEEGKDGTFDPKREKRLVPDKDQSSGGWGRSAGRLVLTSLIGSAISGVVWACIDGTVIKWLWGLLGG